MIFCYREITDRCHYSQRKACHTVGVRRYLPLETPVRDLLVCFFGARRGLSESRRNFPASAHDSRNVPRSLSNVGSPGTLHSDVHQGNLSGPSRAMNWGVHSDRWWSWSLSEPHKLRLRGNYFLSLISFSIYYSCPIDRSIDRSIVASFDWI